MMLINDVIQAYIYNLLTYTLSIVHRRNPQSGNMADSTAKSIILVISQCGK